MFMKKKNDFNTYQVQRTLSSVGIFYNLVFKKTERNNPVQELYMQKDYIRDIHQFKGRIIFRDPNYENERI